MAQNNEQKEPFVVITEEMSEAEARKCFLNALRTHHPDKNQGDEKAAEARTKQIMGAYDAFKAGGYGGYRQHIEAHGVKPSEADTPTSFNVAQEIVRKPQKSAFSERAMHNNPDKPKKVVQKIEVSTAKFRVKFNENTPTIDRMAFILQCAQNPYRNLGFNMGKAKAGDTQIAVVGKKPVGSITFGGIFTKIIDVVAELGGSLFNAPGKEGEASKALPDKSHPLLGPGKS